MVHQVLPDLHSLRIVSVKELMAGHGAPLHLPPVVPQVENLGVHPNPVQVPRKLLADVRFPPSRKTHHNNDMRGGGGAALHPW